MKYLIYLSTSVNLLDDAAIHELLNKSRARNAAANITGVLLYHDGSFIQLLEGAAEDVDSTFARISKDASHKNVIVIDEDNLDHRNFGDWSMGYKRATREEFEGIEAYTDPRKVAERSTGESHPALTSLKTFVQANLG